MKTAIAVLSLMLFLAACGGTPPPPPAAPPVVAVAEPTPPPAEPAPVEKPVEAKPAVASGADAKNIEYDQNDFITNVACDYQKGTISFTMKNNAGKDLTLYHGEVPQAKNSLKISINGMQFNSPRIDVKLDCGATDLKAGETRSCAGENIQYRKPEAEAETGYNQKGKNRLLAQYIGNSDVTFFECFS